MKRPRIIKDGVQFFLNEGQRGTDWIWFVCASSDERASVDQWLTLTNHPLAAQAGTPESRFRAIVQEIAEREHGKKEETKKEPEEAPEPEASSDECA